MPEHSEQHIDLYTALHMIQNYAISVPFTSETAETAF